MPRPTKWIKDAALLVVVVSRKNFEYDEKYSITDQYDAGSAWENLALEASSRRLVAHGMQGFDYETKNYLLFSVPNPWVSAYFNRIQKWTCYRSESNSCC
jgi:hypothetical protein